MKKYLNLKQLYILHFFTILLSLSIASCTTVTLVSDYDEETDKLLMNLQETTDDFIIELIKNAGTTENAFVKHLDTYEKIDKQLRKIEFRVNSIPKNSKTIKLVSNIRVVVLGKGECNIGGASLRDLHCMQDNMENGPSVLALEINQRNVNQSIGAALALEIAKKQGAEENK